MVSARTAGAVLVVAGSIACTVAGRQGQHTPPFRGGYWVLAADFHIHGFPGDGGLPPRDIIREARRRELDVIGISDHNEMLPASFGGRASLAAAGVLALPADEVTTRVVHIIAVGIATPVDWRQSPAAIIDAIHAQGGVAIAAHPSGVYGAGFDDDAVGRLDGVEAAHPEIYVDRRTGPELAAFAERARKLKPAIAFMGASDFHTLQPMGVCRTYLLVDAVNSTGVLEAIRSGRATACDADGRSYGNPDYVRLTASECRAHATSTPPHAALNQIGTGCAWLGLVILTLFGPKVTRPFAAS